MKLSLFRSADESLEEYVARLQAIDASRLSVHQQKVCALCISDAKKQLKAKTRSAKGSRGSTATTVRSRTAFAAASAPDAVEQFHRLWDGATSQEREQMVKYMADRSSNAKGSASTGRSAWQWETCQGRG